MNNRVYVYVDIMWTKEQQDLKISGEWVVSVSSLDSCEVIVKGAHINENGTVMKAVLHYHSSNKIW